jgi:hypothetical protein
MSSTDLAESWWEARKERVFLVGDETVCCLGDKTESLGGKCLLLTQSKSF